MRPNDPQRTHTQHENTIFTRLPFLYQHVKLALKWCQVLSVFSKLQFKTSLSGLAVFFHGILLFLLVFLAFHKVRPVVRSAVSPCPPHHHKSLGNASPSLCLVYHEPRLHRLKSALFRVGELHQVRGCGQKKLQLS